MGWTTFGKYYYYGVQEEFQIQHNVFYLIIGKTASIFENIIYIFIFHHKDTKVTKPGCEVKYRIKPFVFFVPWW